MASFVGPLQLSPRWRKNGSDTSSQLLGYELPTSQQFASQDDVVVISGRLTDMDGFRHKAYIQMADGKAEVA